MHRCLAIAVIASLLSLPSFGHSVSGRIVEAKPAVVEFRYSTGEPMAFAEITVLGPGPKVFQTGRADAAGLFAFIANAQGTWKVEAKDEEKHTAQVSLVVSEASVVQRPWQSWLNSALAISLVFNLFALIRRWQNARSTIKSGPE